jgi:hypothetical protein
MRASGRFGWGFGLAAALLAVAIAMVAYNVGVSDGAAAGATATEAVRRVQWSGHGGVFLWPLLWVAFFAFFWRGACWRRHYWYGGPGYYGPRPPADLDDDFDRRHRQAHTRMKEQGSADDSGYRG